MPSLPILEATKPDWKPLVQHRPPEMGRAAKSSENAPVRWPGHKVLLVNPPYLDLWGKMNVGGNYGFPLGLGYVAGVLREAGFPVEFLDPEPFGLDLAAVEYHIRESAPAIVGITCVTPNFRGAVQIAQLVRRVSDALIVLGGVHATSLPEYTLKTQPEFDVVVTGEGEYTMRELCLAVATGNPDWSDIKGIAYRRDGEVVRNPYRPLVENLDDIPLPARDLTDMNKYRVQVRTYKGLPTASMVTSRGCPARCTFCAVGVTMGHGFRVHSPEYVISEIEELQKRWGIEHIVFADDEFTVGKKRAEILCKAFIDHGLKFEWHCFSRVNDMSPELLRLMKDAGCTSVLYGIETGDEQVLRLMKKGSSLGAARRAVQWANDIDLKTQGSFIIGCYGDTHESIKRTIDFACEINPTIASFNVMVPFPGTEDWNRMIQTIPEQLTNWENFTVTASAAPVIQLENITRQDLQRYLYKAYIKFYGRPSQVWRMLKSLSSLGELWSYARGALGLIRQILDWRQKSKDRGRALPSYPFSNTM